MRSAFAVVIVLSMSLTACSSSRIATNVIEVEGMNNSVEVGDDLLIGGQPSADALAHLATSGYQTILSARAPSEVDWDEKKTVEFLGMNYISVPMPNPVTGITDEQVELFDEAMGAQDGPMVLHCGSGNRIAGLWAVWLVEKKGFAVEEAIEVAERAGMKSVRTAVEKRLGVAAAN